MITVGTREFTRNISKYLQSAKKGKEVLITNRNDKGPLIKLSIHKTASIRDLKGLITNIKGDINEPVFPPFDQWYS